MDGFELEPSNAMERRQIRRYRSKVEEKLKGEDESLSKCSMALLEAYLLGGHDDMSRPPEEVCEFVIEMARKLSGIGFDAG